MKNLKLLSKKRPKSVKEIINILLTNRGLKLAKDKKDFFSPKKPQDVSLKDVGLDSRSIGKAITRIKKALKNKEKIIVYGDYDADGICASAILWETLWKLKAEVVPHIPGRFIEGYGLNAKSVETLKSKNPDLALIITVDNGIVAYEGVKKASELGIDVIITDHHQKGRKKPVTDYVIHSTLTSGAGIVWFFSREIKKKKKNKNIPTNTLELSAIGTVADQIPLFGINRSLVSHGLKALGKTNRVGILALSKQARMEIDKVNVYGINYILAPRINSMGRLKNGIDSLRLLCTTNVERAEKLSRLLNKTNIERQKIVRGVLSRASKDIASVSKKNIILLSHKDYHEGVIGLAAGKLMEEYYRPSIVISKQKEISKASARSIKGFDIIKAIRRLDNLIEEGGGHPMAAGFSIKTENIEKFYKKINSQAKEKLTKDILTRKQKADVEIEFEHINWNLEKKLREFEPAGIGNSKPTFLTKDVDVIEIKAVGKDMSHLKLKLAKAPALFDAIAFGKGELVKKIKKGDKIDVVYSIEENIWNGNRNLQLMVKKID